MLQRGRLLLRGRPLSLRPSFGQSTVAGRCESYSSAVVRRPNVACSGMRCCTPVAAPRGVPTLSATAAGHDARRGFGTLPGQRDAGSGDASESTGFYHGDVRKLHPANPTPGQVEGDKTTLQFTTAHSPGSLEEVLRLFWKHDVNMTRIESRPKKKSDANVDFVVDFQGLPGMQKIDALLQDIADHTVEAAIVDPRTVPWFPTQISDIDHFSTKTLDAGAELEADHPGFNDPEYRERRRMIVEAAASYKFGQSIPRVDYSDEETATWGVVYRKLADYTKKYAVSQYHDVMAEMEQHIGFSADCIPQLEDISGFLKSKSGFTLRPVGGLLSARDFLNGLAFKVFFSTQYIRHHTKPLYTPEPDIVHELLGHAPMFADKEFADFSQEIGLASLGASDEDVKKLATCYWFSVEFGLAEEAGMTKAYGAGLLSSFGELEYACSPTRPAGGEDKFPEYLPWDPEVAATTEYPITCYQPKYFVAQSMSDAKERMREFSESLNRPFHVTYDEETGSVQVDRAVKRAEYCVTLQT